MATDMLSKLTSLREAVTRAEVANARAMQELKTGFDVDTVEQGRALQEILAGEAMSIEGDLKEYQQALERTNWDAV